MAGRFDRIDAMMLLLVAIWGSAFAGLRALRGDLDPFQMTWYRYALFPVAYGIWIALRRRDRLRMVSGPDWLRMGVLGTIAVVGYHFPLNIALHGGGGVGVSAAAGAVIVSTVPVWTMLLAVLSGKEPLRVQAASWTAVAFAGVSVVILLGSPDASLELGLLGLLALLAPLSWAIYGVWAKPLIQQYGGLFTTGTTMSLGTLVLVPIGAMYGTAPLQGLDRVEWAWLLFVAVFATVAGYALYNNALKHRAASDVAVYIYLVPIAATLVAWLTLGETVTLWFYAGTGLVLLGVVQVQRSRTGGRQDGVEGPASGTKA